MDLANEESSLKNIYYDIGKKVHEIYAYGGSLGEFFDGKYMEIKNAEASIKALKDRLDDAKRMTKCQNCGKSVSRDSEFCPKCGVGMTTEVEQDDTAIDRKETDLKDIYLGSDLSRDEAIEPIQTMNTEDEKLKLDTKKCPICSYENIGTEKFCNSCGRML